MKHYYLNKVAMAVLLALLLFFGTRTLIDIIYEEDLPATPGYEVAGAEEELVHGDKKKDGPDKGAEFIAALNKADPAKGEQGVGLCKVCHSFEKGGPNMIGPGLYGVVGHEIAAHEGFKYSAALKDHGGEWTFESMDAWLENPAGFAAGTSMAFPGIKDLQKRADVIAYLNQNSDNPLPIPEPKAAPAADEKAEDAAGESGKPEVLALLAEADPAKGEQASALCKVCHTFDAGGASMVGPNLHNVVGADVGHVEGFNYSAALKDKGGAWTYERLDEWLKNPQAFAPGTTMAFPGIPDAKKRANVIAFLRSHTENPPELPAGDAEAAPAEDAATAEEETKAAEEEAKPEEAVAPAEDETKAAEEEAKPEEAVAPAEDEAKPAEEEAKPEEAAAPAEDEAKPAEEPASEEPKEVEADTIVNSPKVSDDAPNAPHAGEPPSPNQPQPVVPGEDSAVTETDTRDAAMETTDETMGETVVNSPEVSADAPSEPHKGEPPSPNQPQPVVPSDESSTVTRADEPSSSDDRGSTSSQPEPVYPNGKPEGL
jgi:cytochrome c2